MEPPSRRFGGAARGELLNCARRDNCVGASVCRSPAGLPGVADGDGVATGDTPYSAVVSPTLPDPDLLGVSETGGNVKESGAAAVPAAAVGWRTVKPSLPSASGLCSDELLLSEGTGETLPSELPRERCGVNAPELATSPANEE